MTDDQLALILKINLDITDLTAKELLVLEQLVRDEKKSREITREHNLLSNLSNQVRQNRVVDTKRALWEKDHPKKQNVVRYNQEDGFFPVPKG